MIGSHSTRCTAFDDLPARDICERDALSRDHGHLLVAEENDVAGVAQDRGDVGGDEELSVAHADDHRRAVADGDDLVGIVNRHEHDREEPAQVAERAPDGPFQAVVAHLALDEVRHDLGIGLGHEPVAVALQLALQIQVVLDDAIVDDDDPPRAVTMWVGVLLRRAAVSRPSRVAHAVLAVHRVGIDDRLEPRQLARAAP